MIELAKWLQTVEFPDRPWLLLGKGPTFSRRAEFDLTPFLKCSLNHVVREMPVEIAHIIDMDVVAACADRLLENAQWVVMPRHPHVQNKPDPARPLESFFASHPVLRQLSERGRLVWYDLRSKVCQPHGTAAPIKVRFFSSEAALHLLARLGVKKVRSLGVDGGRSYSPSFADVQQATLLANQQPSFDLQFREIAKITAEHGLDYETLIPPMRVFVGGDETEEVAARVLEHSIRKHASGPVEVTIMRDYVIPVPKHKRNRARTKFSFYRFRIPELCGYRGRALYVDSDMLVFRDLAELWRIPFGEQKVLCTFQKDPPPAWKDYSWFHPGRQFSVMLLDCDRLPWKVEEIVRAMDEEKFQYENLMFEMCLVRHDEIGERVPVEWNHLEQYEAGRTALTHFTVVPTQPWKTDATPLNSLWMAAYEDAVAAGAVDPKMVRAGIAGGWYKPQLEAALARAPAFWSWTDPDAVLQPKASEKAAKHGAAPVGGEQQRLQQAEETVQRLQRDIDALRGSWTWRVGRLVTAPLRLFGGGRSAAAQKR